MSFDFWIFNLTSPEFNLGSGILRQGSGIIGPRIQSKATHKAKET